MLHDILIHLRVHYAETSRGLPPHLLGFQEVGRVMPVPTIIVGIPQFLCLYAIVDQGNLRVYLPLYRTIC